MSLTSHGDEGSIVVGWLTKLVAVAAIVGVVGFDAITIGLGHLTTASDADNAVQAASQSYELHHDVQAAFTAAGATLNSHEELEIKGFAIQPDGTTTLTVTNTVKAMLIDRFSQTKSWAVVQATSTGKYTGS